MGNTYPSLVQTLSIGVGHPLVPARIVRKIESGAFVEMSDLLPEQLGTTGSEDEIKLRQKRWSLSILERLQCYVVYVVVVTRRQPRCITELMGYQSLIETHMECKNDLKLDRL